MMHKHIPGAGNIYKFEYCPICNCVPESEWAPDPPKNVREMLNDISDLDYERGRERGRFEGACLVMIGTLIMLAIMFLVRHGAT